MPCPGIKGRLNGHDLHQVKAEFIRLYLEEDRQLKDIVQTFKDRGLDASVQHWKTQMREWGIGRYNRESDMIFAAQKAKSRKDTLGKDTVFKIRGSEKSVQDVKHYLRRRRQQHLSDGNFLPDNPRTPEGVTYFTPLTSPLLAQLQAIPNSICEETTAAEDVLNQNALVLYSAVKGHADASHGMDLNDQFIIDQLVYDPMHFRSRSSGLPPTPTAPDIFYTVEIALSAIKDYYGSTLATGRAETLSKDQSLLAHVDLLGPLVENLNKVCHYLKIGNSYSAEAPWEDMCRSLPDVVTCSSTEPLVFTALLGLVLSLRKVPRNFGQEFSRMVSRVSFPGLKKDNPIRKVFETLSLVDEPITILEILTRQARDYLCGYLPVGHILRLYFAHLLCGIYAHQDDWTATLNHAVTLNRSIKSSSAADVDIQILKVFSVRICFSSYLNLEKFEDALQTLETFLSDVLETSCASHLYHTGYLVMRGEFHRRTGNIQGAVTDLRTAWEWASQHLGIGDSDTLRIVTHSNDAEHGGPFWAVI